MLIAASQLFGGTGRPEDGFLFFLVILGFLGLILGILYLVDYIKILIRRFTDEILKFL
jgi:hypothetical protein